MDALLETYPALLEIRSLAQTLLTWVLDNVFVVAHFLQLITIGVIFLVIRRLSPRVEGLLDNLTVPGGYEAYDKYLQNVMRAIKLLILPVLWIIVQSVSVLVAKNAGWPFHVLESAVSLLTAWIIIRLATSVVADPGWSRAIAVSAWSLAALDIVGMLDPTLAVLDNMPVSNSHIYCSGVGHCQKNEAGIRAMGTTRRVG